MFLRRYSLDQLAISFILQQTMHEVITYVIPHPVIAQLHRITVRCNRIVPENQSSLRTLNFSTIRHRLQIINFVYFWACPCTYLPQPTWPQIKQIHRLSDEWHSKHLFSATTSGVWTYRQTGQLQQSILFSMNKVVQKKETKLVLRNYLVSPHFDKQLLWNEWLQRIVRIPSTDSSILSRHTGQVGSSVCPGGSHAFSSSLRISTRETKTNWHTYSGSNELNGAPLYVR